MTAIAKSHGGFALQTKPVSAVLSDSEAVDRARQGDHAAFRVLVERYEGRALALARRILRDEDQARDAVQDAFLKAYESLRAFEERSAFYTWFYRVVYNRCLDLKRRARHRPQVRLPDEPGLEDALVGPGAEEGVGASRFVSAERTRDRHELRAVLEAAIQALPDDSREILLLREIQDLSYAEIAKVLSIPKGTVMSRLHHARRRMRELLEGSGVELGGGGGENDRG